MAQGKSVDGSSFNVRSASALSKRMVSPLSASPLSQALPRRSETPPAIQRPRSDSPVPMYNITIRECDTDASSKSVANSLLRCKTDIAYHKARLAVLEAELKEFEDQTPMVNEEGSDSGKFFNPLLNSPEFKSPLGSRGFSQTLLTLPRLEASGDPAPDENKQNPLKILGKSGSRASMSLAPLKRSASFDVESSPVSIPPSPSPRSGDGEMKEQEESPSSKLPKSGLLALPTASLLKRSTSHQLSSRATVVYPARPQSARNFANSDPQIHLPGITDHRIRLI